jgi:hypothetical protein
LAIGLFSGQISQEGKFHDPYGDNKVARFTAAGQWLDKVSSEEKLN